jgi:hypothetical protein
MDFDQQFDLSFKEDQILPEIKINASGAIGGKTGKTAVLPGFCKIEHSGGSGGALSNYGGLTLPVRGHRASSATQCYRAKVGNSKQRLSITNKSSKFQGATLYSKIAKISGCQ